MSWITNINSITWAANPSVNQSVDVKYRQGGTSGAYTDAGIVVFAPDGTIVGATPFQITGINDSWASIDIDFVNQCSMVDHSQTFTKPV